MDNIELNNTLIEPQHQSNISAEHFKMLGESLFESRKWMNRMIIISMVGWAVLLFVSLAMMLAFRQKVPGITIIFFAGMFSFGLLLSGYMLSLLYKHSKNLKMFGESKNSEYLVASFAYYEKYWVVQGSLLVLVIIMSVIMMLLRFLS